MDYNQAKQLLGAHAQLQLLDYYGTLDNNGKERLLSDIEKIDFKLLSAIGENDGRRIGNLSPARTLSVKETEARSAEYKKAGIQALKNGKAAAVLLAGGQGTRLGSQNPKGMFNIGVDRELSIFAQQFENIKDVVKVTDAPFHIFIMTSTATDGKTRAFFKEKNYFGYPSSYVHFFVQDSAPACSFDGKILLEEKDKVAFSPNGNGGWYTSLINSTAGNIIQSNGIEWINVYGVDNVLQRICDPVFIGATILSGADCSSKVVKKVNAAERVGVMCLEDGKPAIVEYYEMPESLAEKTNADGELTFGYGVILNYLFKVEKLDAVKQKPLPVHLSKKAVPHIKEGAKVTPSQPNAYKFEYLVLDLVKLMDDCLAVEVVREREFAPVKNRTGADSVYTARALLLQNGVKL